MKKLFLFFVVLAVGSGCAFADVCVTTTIKAERYENDELKETQDQGVEEFWIGKNRAAYHTPNFVLVLDKSEDRFLFINPKRKTYVESPLPVKMDNVIAPELLKTRMLKRSSGNVVETEDSDSVLDLTCQVYEVNTWTVYGVVPKDKRTLKVWATTKADVELALHDEILVLLRQIFNRDAHYMKELEKIEGIQMRLELWMKGDDFDQRFLQEVTDISEQDPGSDIYAIPDSFAKQDYITAEDF